MAGGQERVLRARIKSVQSTKKITRAMELIAATRVVKAQDRAAAARPYSDEITAVIIDLLQRRRRQGAPAAARATPTPTPRRSWSSPPTAACAAPTTATSSAWPSGRSRRPRPQGLDYSLIVVGKKAQKHFRFRGMTDRRRRSSRSPTSPPTSNARDVAATVRRRYETGELAYVDLAYTRFLSAGVQQAVVRRFLPLEVPAVDRHRRPVGRPRVRAVAHRASSTRSCPATSSPASSRRCSTPRPPSTPPASGP